MVHPDPAFSKEAMVSINVPFEDKAIIHKKMGREQLYLLPGKFIRKLHS
jgi:hypothetical protein